MKRLIIAITIAVAMTVSDSPPPPSGLVTSRLLLSPKYQEFKASLGTAMVKPSVVPLAKPTGFLITNITVTGNALHLSWQQGEPPFQVEGLYGDGWHDVGPTTTDRVSHLTISQLSGSVLFRVAQSPILGTISVRTPRKVNTVGAVHYLAYSDGSFARFGKWGTNYADFTYTTIPWFSFLRSPVCEVSGNTVVIADIGSSGLPNPISEFDYSAGTLFEATNFTFGVASDMSSCQSTNGQMFFFSYRLDQAQATRFFLTVLKRETNGVYSSQEFNLPSSTADTYPAILTGICFNGEVWLLATRDSGQCVSRYRFTAGLSLIQAEACFASGTIDMGVELPVCTAVVDTVNNKVVLGHLSSTQQYRCGDAVLMSPTSYQTVDANSNVVHLATTAWWSYHADFPIQPMFPYSDHLGTLSQNVNMDCDHTLDGYSFANLSGGTFSSVSTPLIGAAVDVASFSEDGWVVYRDSSYNYKLGKY